MRQSRPGTTFMVGRDFAYAVLSDARKREDDTAGRGRHYPKRACAFWIMFRNIRSFWLSSLLNFIKKRETKIWVEEICTLLEYN
jgi:hypothetical protein